MLQLSIVRRLTSSAETCRFRWMALTSRRLNMIKLWTCWRRPVVLCGCVLKGRQPVDMRSSRLLPGSSHSTILSPDRKNYFVASRLILHGQCMKLWIDQPGSSVGRTPALQAGGHSWYVNTSALPEPKK